MSLDTIIQSEETRKFLAGLPGKISLTLKRVYEQLGERGLADVLWELEYSTTPVIHPQPEDKPTLSVREIRRALQRERLIKMHYKGKDTWKHRGGRPSKIQPLFEAVKSWMEGNPKRTDLHKRVVERIAMQYGSHAARGVKLSYTSQWRLNKMLQQAGYLLIPWGKVRVMTEEDVELEILQLLRKQRETEAI